MLNLIDTKDGASFQDRRKSKLNHYQQNPRLWTLIWKRLFGAKRKSYFALVSWASLNIWTWIISIYFFRNNFFFSAWKPSFDNRQFGPFHLHHGHEGTLQCNPNAEPRPKFQWFVDGVLISDGAVNSRYRLPLDGTLVIKTVDKDKDAVNYTCKAVNMMGNASATTVPTVLGKIPMLIMWSNEWFA